MNDDCTGKGTCHGPVTWCYKCGDVTWVCDDHECDLHNQRLLGVGGYDEDKAIGRKKLKEHLATKGKYRWPHDRLWKG